MIVCPPQAFHGGSTRVLVMWTGLCTAKLSGIYIAQHLTVTPETRSQLPEEIQPHLTHAFRLICKYLTNQLSKRFGVPHVRLHKRYEEFSELLRGGKRKCSVPN